MHFVENFLWKGFWNTEKISLTTSGNNALLDVFGKVE